MNSDVVSVRPLDGYRMAVTLRDGREGIFDMKPYLDFGVFRELREVGYFQQVHMSFGAVTWPHGQDIAPQTRLAGLEGVQTVQDES